MRLRVCNEEQLLSTDEGYILIDPAIVTMSPVETPSVPEGLIGAMKD